uniref:Secreted protein n=1 Tax=Plectus sambesii TaxID=2011161 RepID=A0A914VB41_9BILA
MKLKRRSLQQWILPVMLYECETWATIEAAEMRAAVAQRRFERRMISVRLLVCRSNAWLRGATRLKNVVKCARRRKQNWASKVARMTSDRWPKQLVEWRPFN